MSHSLEVPALEAKKVSFAFGSRVAIRGESLAVHRNQTVGIVGRSGTGKTTLLQLLAGLLQPQAGEVLLEGRRIDNQSEKHRSLIRLRCFGFVFQFGELVPELTLSENVELPLRLLGKSRAESREESARVLVRLGIGHIADSRPGNVSGGEMQRAAVARAVVHRPTVVFADEPTGALDADNRDSVMSLLLESTAAVGASLVLATHDPVIAQSLDRCFRIDSGILAPMSSV